MSETKPEPTVGGPGYTREAWINRWNQAFPKMGPAQPFYWLLDAAFECEELRAGLMVPGEQACPVCEFSLSKLVLRASDGAVGVNTAAPLEMCPNGCGPLIGVTYERALKQMVKVCETQVQRATEAEAQLEEAKREIDIYVADAQANANHVFGLEQQLAEAKRKAADLVERLRARWPHIEVAWIPLLKDDKRTRVDPGPPTCLRCALEEVIGEGR